MKLKVKLGTVANAVLFSAKCNEYECDIDYRFNRYMIDAKSLVGIIGAGLNHICEVHMHTEDDSVKRRFKEDMSLWIVED